MFGRRGGGGIQKLGVRTYVGKVCRNYLHFCFYRTLGWVWQGSVALQVVVVLGGRVDRVGGAGSRGWGNVGGPHNCEGKCTRCMPTTRISMGCGARNGSPEDLY